MTHKKVSYLCLLIRTSMCRGLGSLRIRNLLSSVDSMANEWLSRKSSVDETALNCKQFCRCEFPTQNQKTVHISSLVFPPAIYHHQTLQMIFQYFFKDTFQKLHHFHIPFLNCFCMIQLLFGSLKKLT